MKKKDIHYAIFNLHERVWISPNMIRIYLSGDNVHDFSAATIGDNNKIFIPSEDPYQVNMPFYDENKNIWVYPNPLAKPHIRTYTHRGIDLEKGLLYIDFAYHGDSGPASAWAANAKEGQPLGLVMKLGGRGPLHPQAKNYVLVGDFTAVPVLSVIMEQLPKTAKVTALLEAPSSQDRIPINTPASLDLTWLVNPHPQQGSLLFETLLEKGISLEDSSRFAYVACEYDTVRKVRKYFKENDWPPNSFYAFSYWKSGYNESDSQSDRHEERHQ